MAPEGFAKTWKDRGACGGHVEGMSGVSDPSGVGDTWGELTHER